MYWDEPADIYSPSSERRNKRCDVAVANCLMTLKCISIVISLVHIIIRCVSVYEYACWRPILLVTSVAFLFLNFDFWNLTVNFRDALIYSNCLFVEIFVDVNECTQHTYSYVCVHVFPMQNLWIIHVTVFSLCDRHRSKKKFKFATFLCYWPLASTCR